MGDLADKLAELVVVDLVCLISSLGLRLLLALARVLATLLT